MDNFLIDLVAESKPSLSSALLLAFNHNAPGGKATHYKRVKLKYETRYFKVASRELQPDLTLENVSHSSGTYERPQGVDSLILLWSAGDKDAMPLPYPMMHADAVEFIDGWLRNGAEYGREPDHDGDNGKGFRVFTEGWGHVAGNTYTICAIQPAYAMYGK